MTKQWAFGFDAARCIGCSACQIACRDDNDLQFVTWRRVIEVSGGEWHEEDGAYTQDVFAYYLSYACNHCENPPCLPVCDEKAISKRDDGIVLIDQEKCTACELCMKACPYNAISLHIKASKCDFCYDRLDEGLPPACVAACPSRALYYGDLSELQAKYGDLRMAGPLPDPGEVGPSLVIKRRSRHER